MQMWILRGIQSRQQQVLLLAVTTLQFFSFSLARLLKLQFHGASQLNSIACLQKVVTHPTHFIYASKLANGISMKRCFSLCESAHAAHLGSQPWKYII